MISVAYAHDLIDAKAGAVRECYITIAPGQEATYMLKAEDARNYKAAGYTGTVPPLVNAEATATGTTATQATDRILYEQEMWRQLAAMIEGTRRAGKIAVSNAVEEQRETIMNGVLAQLAGMMS